MPPRNWKIRITDILTCIAKIRRYTKGYTFDDFQGDEKTVDSVLRNLEIIGEAARQIPADVKAAYPALPWAEMLTMRNIVIHEYHGVNLSIIWQTIKEDSHPWFLLLSESLKRINSAKSAVFLSFSKPDRHRPPEGTPLRDGVSSIEGSPQNAKLSSYCVHAGWDVQVGGQKTCQVFILVYGALQWVFVMGF